MIGKTFSDKELIMLLENNLSFLSFSKDEKGHLISIDFNLEKILNEINSNRVAVIVSYIREKLYFLKQYGYEIEEIIYVYHFSISDIIIYISFLRPVNNNFGKILYAKK